MLCTLIGVTGENCASVGVGLVAALVGLAIGSLVTWKVADRFARLTKRDIDAAVSEATKRLVEDVPRQIGERLDAVAKGLAQTIPEDAAARVTKNTLVNTAINAAPFFATLAATLIKPQADPPPGGDRPGAPPARPASPPAG